MIFSVDVNKFTEYSVLVHIFNDILKNQIQIVGYINIQ